MKKLLAAGLLAAVLAPVSATADITVKLPAGHGLDSLNYSKTSIVKLATAKSRAERGTVNAAAPIKDNVAVVAVDAVEGGSQYVFTVGDRSRFLVYAAPGDEIVAEVVATSPVDVNLSGTPLIDGMNEIDAMTEPIMTKYRELGKMENPPRDEMKALGEQYDQTLKDYITENPTNPNSTYAIMELSGEDFLEMFPLLSERAKTSILYPLVEAQKVSVEKRVEKERKQAEMAKGDVTAPDFALKDLEGKTVKLSDFRGKWVILDFWGSWCIWCIRGLPELKDAYAKYHDVLEVVGVDCNETEEAWRAGVKKYDLTWVNVYNPKDSGVLDEYGVQGFPTKAIIDPEGKIRNITTGHKPDFFDTLSQLIGK